MPRLLEIRAAIQAKILAQSPQLSADASEPYCRLICRRALRLVAREIGELDTDPALQPERHLLEQTFGEEIAALRHDFFAECDRIAAQAADAECPAASLVISTFDAFIYGEAQATPRSLKAIRARVDAGLYLVSRWGGKKDGLPADKSMQHRQMVWLLALGCDAPGLLHPLDPHDPEQWAAMCETLFEVEITALKGLLGTHGRRVVRRAATKAQAEAELETLLDELERRFVGDDLRCGFTPVTRLTRGAMTPTGGGMMRSEPLTLRALRARVQTKLESIARHDGETLTAEDVQQLCGAMMMLGQFGDSEPFRIRNPAEDTLEMETHLAWVTTHVLEESARLDELSVEPIQRYHCEGQEGDESDAGVMREVLAFIEGYDDPRQLRLFT
jgi:hypothetical protein